MYKRNRENTNELSLNNVYTKQAKIEPLGKITDTIANEMNQNEKLSNIADKADSHIQETHMEWETIEDKFGTKEKANKILDPNQAFKFNGICDRDRRRHMYF